jgi:hypothetical protein
MRSLQAVHTEGFVVGAGLVTFLALTVIVTFQLAWEYWPASRPAWLRKLAEPQPAATAPHPVQPQGGVK